MADGGQVVNRAVEETKSMFAELSQEVCREATAPFVPWLLSVDS